MSDPADRINLCRCGGDPEPLRLRCADCNEGQAA